MSQFQEVDKFIESLNNEVKNFSSEGIPQNVLGLVWEICLYTTSFSLSDLNSIIQTLKSARESLPETGQESLKEKISNLETIVASFKEFHTTVKNVISTPEGESPGN